MLNQICAHLNKMSDSESLMRTIQMVISILERDLTDNDDELDATNDDMGI